MSKQYRNEVERHVVNGCNVIIMQDTTPENPRTEYDNACTMVCWDKRRRLGDDHEFATPLEFGSWWAANHVKDGTLKPLYLYEHGEVAISTTPFSCQWDSGQVGYAYITREKAESEGLTDPAKIIEGEVETYGQYLNGEVYGFAVEDEEGNVIESCWGFFGLDSVKEEAFAVANSVRDHVKYKHDKGGSPVSATLSIRVDRQDFARITGRAFTDSDFKAAIERLAGRMRDAVATSEAQREVLHEVGVEG